MVEWLEAFSAVQTISALLVDNREREIAKEIRDLLTRALASAVRKLEACEERSESGTLPPMSPRLLPPSAVKRSQF